MAQFYTASEPGLSYAAYNLPSGAGTANFTVTLPPGAVVRAAYLELVRNQYTTCAAPATATVNGTGYNNGVTVFCHENFFNEWWSNMRYDITPEITGSGAVSVSSQANITTSLMIAYVDPSETRTGTVVFADGMNAWHASYGVVADGIVAQDVLLDWTCENNPICNPQDARFTRLGGNQYGSSPDAGGGDYRDEISDYFSDAVRWQGPWGQLYQTSCAPCAEAPSYGPGGMNAAFLPGESVMRWGLDRGPNGTKGTFWVNALALNTFCDSPISPSPTPTPTLTATNTVTVTFTVTLTDSPTPTNTPTSTLTSTPSYTLTVSPTPSPTHTPTVSPSPTVTLTSTPSPSPTPTATVTATPTSTLTATQSPTPSPTATVTASPTVTATPSETVTPSQTPSDTNTATVTASPTQTATVTVTSSPSHTPTPTPTASITWTFSPTASWSASPTASATSSTTATPSATQSATHTPTATPTATQSRTHTFTPTSTNTVTASNTPTPSSTSTGTPSPSHTPTETATPTVSTTATPTPTSSDSPTSTPSATATPTFTATPTRTTSSTHTPTPVPLPYHVVLRMYNSAGEVVKVLFDGDAAGRPSNPEPNQELFAVDGNNTLQWSFDEAILPGMPLILWKGDNDNGQVVGGGTYYLKVEIIDRFGKVETFNRAVEVARAFPSQGLTLFNTAGEVVASFDMGLYGEEIVDFSTAESWAWGAPGTSAGLTVLLTGRSGATYSLVWDGRNPNGSSPSSGTYSLVLSTESPGGPTEIRSHPVSIIRGEGLALELLAWPNPADPNRGPMMVRMSGALSGDSWQAKIYNLAGELVLESYQPQSQGWIQVGRLSDGIYWLEGMSGGSGQRAVTKFAVAR